MCMFANPHNICHNEQKSISSNQKLLRDFFASASCLLTVRGEVRVSLREVPPYTTWDVVAQVRFDYVFVFICFALLDTCDDKTMTGGQIKVAAGGPCAFQGGDLSWVDSPFNPLAPSCLSHILRLVVPNMDICTTDRYAWVSTKCVSKAVQKQRRLQDQRFESIMYCFSLPV